MTTRYVRGGLAFALLAAASLCHGQQPRVLDFQADPRWDGFRNRLVPDPPPKTRQDFGYRKTNHAQGQAPGEIGGRVERSLRPASYAKAIAPKTLQDALSVSGRFAVTGDEGGSGVLFGWFHEDSRGWRTPNSLAIRLDGNGGKYWVVFEYGTQNWKTGGGATYEGRYQTTKTLPFRADGTVHSFTFKYDPAGNQRNGELTLVLDGKTYTAPLAPGHKADGAVFNRFGIWNQQISGDAMELYFDDLVIDGAAEDFSSDPRWLGVGNQSEFADRAIRSKQDFGYSATRYAGGTQGEIGGIVWRDELPAYYGAPIEALTLDDALQASGKICFRGAGSDSGVFLGWFDSRAKQARDATRGEPPGRNQLGITIDGPSRVGHYFRAEYRNALGEGVADEVGPLIKPDGKTHEWSLRYRPAREGKAGAITVTLDDHSQTLELKAQHLGAGARFDRFGIGNIQPGGHFVEIYLDDLSFTGKAPQR